MLLHSKRYLLELPYFLDLILQRKYRGNAIDSNKQSKYKNLFHLESQLQR